MIWFRTAIAIVLLALWVPATMHCQLESVLDLEALSCCTHDADASSTAHHEADCEANECRVVESGLYKLKDEQCLVPDLPRTTEVTQIALAEAALELSSVPETALAPPELLQSWLFTLRAAPAPRAPSS